MNSTFYEFINIESNIRHFMDGLPAEVNLYDFIKYISFSYRFLIWENCLFSHAGDMWRCLDESGADWIEKKSLPAHVGKRRLMAPGGPVFALTSFASAGDSWRKTTRLR